MILKEYNLSVRLPQEKAIDTGITLVQNDKDVYKLNIRIFDGVNEIDYSQIADATITFALANNAVVQSDPERLTISAEGISYEMGTSEISRPGKVLASIQLIGENGERLTTARFQFEVVADLIKPSVVIGSNEFPILQKLVADVEQLKQDIVNLQIPDNSILDVKLSDAAGQIKSQVNAHLAESASKHITESGSNANGYYIKFDDGTQICMHTMVGSDFGLPTSTTTSTTVQGISFYRSTQKTWGLPAPFVDTNYVVQIHTKSSTNGIRLNWVNLTGNKRTDRVSALQIISLYNDFSGFESVDLVAIGRWK